MLLDVLRVDAGFTLEAGPPGHAPWELLGIVELGRTARYEEVRNFFLIEVFLDRRITGRSHYIEEYIDLVGLHKLTNLLDSFGRRVAVIVGNEIDLPAVDPTP